MKLLVIDSWLLLFRFEIVMYFRDFRALHRIVERQRVRLATPCREPLSKELCDAVDLACVFYFKRVLCLQRSAATTLLLRKHGLDAQMVIGAQILPFKSHAWVEIQELVVNDKPYMLDIYQVLERC
jgi:hypothetical protein